MDKATLVGLDIERGREVLDALDNAGIKVAAALWVYLAEYEDWRLVLAARQFDNLALRDAYRKAHDVLDAVGITVYKTPPLMILPMTDPLMKGLRRIFSKAASVEGMRLGGQMIGDRFIEDAYVYRIS